MQGDVRLPLHVKMYSKQKQTLHCNETLRAKEDITIKCLWKGRWFLGQEKFSKF
jgi:hypothetical protein